MRELPEFVKRQFAKARLLEHQREACQEYYRRQQEGKQKEKLISIEELRQKRNETRKSEIEGPERVF
jgi:hypothetical protein